MAELPFRGGRMRFPDGDDRYPNGKSAWRCSWCGSVGPWDDGWSGYWSLRDEDDGLYADHGRGYPVSCSTECYTHVMNSGACSPYMGPVTVKRER